MDEQSELEQLRAKVEELKAKNPPLPQFVRINFKTRSNKVRIYGASGFKFDVEHSVRTVELRRMLEDIYVDATKVEEG